MDTPMNTENVDENDQYKAVMLFGRDIRKIPCFKNSMLYGIYSGFATGLATFMFTSRIPLSTSMALGSYMGVSMVYWCFCRYNYVMQKYEMNDIQYVLRNKSTPSEREEINKVFPKEEPKLIDT
ncbi:cytochrome c oxidase assembly protein COX20, mitochondrial [Linepithema humile]|uniref:cytochrome c oxidase assembly protein COX20, mitochondrial n=1 Tax=Linepithema humile TaxID=83485 RepID=UPI00062355DB|nr:PREDICTED: cytochrome c oxidase protein 20 homolog [Linepithema humile]